MTTEPEQMNLFKNYTLVIKPSIVRYISEIVKEECKEEFNKMIKSSENYITWAHKNNLDTEFTYIIVPKEWSVKDIETSYKILFQTHCMFKEED